MKIRVAWMACATMLFLCSTVLAEPKLAKNVISIDPVALAFNTLSLKYERMVSFGTSVGVLASKTILGRGRVEQTEWDILAIGLFTRSYTGTRYMRGTYIELGGEFRTGDYYSTVRRESVLNHRAIAVTGKGGHTFRLFGVILSPYVGYSVPFVLDRGRSTGSVTVDPLGGLLFGVEVGFGFAW